MRASRFLAAVAAVLFTAVCAYAFAGLYGAVAGTETEQITRITVSDSVFLDGLAVRTEQLLASSRYIAVLAADGERLPAGGLLAQNGSDWLTTACSAIFFSDFDGLEHLTPADCENLTVSTLTALMAEPPTSVGSAFGRLVTGYAWYYAAFVDADAEIPESGRYTIRFEGMDSAAKCQIMSVSAKEGGKRAVLLRLSSGGDFLRLRRVKAELVLYQYTGLALPPEAVRQDERGEYVFVASSGFAEREAVEIIYRGGEVCLATSSKYESGLTEGSMVVTSGDNIYEGCVID